MVDGIHRVDILVDPSDFLHSGAHPTQAGDQFTVTLTGTGGDATLTVLNAVNVDVNSTLALVVTGTECGETIVVDDDFVDANNDDIDDTAASDAKAIFIGSVSGDFNGTTNLEGQGIKYNSAIIDALFGGPTISRVEVKAGGGDDTVRVTDRITQQSTLDGGAGNDNIRGGGGKATIIGQAGADLLIGGQADDVINGGDGDDLAFGLGGADRVFGGNGNDQIAGGDGDDPLLRGGNGNDRLSGGSGRDRLLGDSGVDILYRDNSDLLASGEVLRSDPPPSPVDQALLDLLSFYWNDGNNSAPGNLTTELDTLDELIDLILFPRT